MSYTALAKQKTIGGMISAFARNKDAMVLIPVTKTGLRSAVRDRRYWQSVYPEREAYLGWVSHGWRAFEGSPYQASSGNLVVSCRP